MKPQPVDGDDIRHTGSQDHKLDKVLDRSLIEKAMKAIEGGDKVRSSRTIVNVEPHGRRDALGRDRQALRRPRPCRTDTIVMKLKGTAGQSFGAFLARGITLLN